jgi:hypothetical protein
MMEAVITSETVVNFYETTWHSIPEDSYLCSIFVLDAMRTWNTTFLVEWKIYHPKKEQAQDAEFVNLYDTGITTGLLARL